MDKRYWRLKIKLALLKWRKRICQLGIWVTGGKNQRYILKRVALSMSIMSVITLLSGCDVIENKLLDIRYANDPASDPRVSCYEPMPMMITEKYGEYASVEIDQKTYGLRESYGDIMVDLDSKILTYSIYETEDISEKEVTIHLMDIDNNVLLDTQVVLPELADEDHWTLSFDLSNIEYDESLYYGIVTDVDEYLFDDIIYVDDEY